MDLSAQPMSEGRRPSRGADRNAAVSPRVCERRTVVPAQRQPCRWVRAMYLVIAWRDRRLGCRPQKGGKLVEKSVETLSKTASKTFSLRMTCSRAYKI